MHPLEISSFIYERSNDLPPTYAGNRYYHSEPNVQFSALERMFLRVNEIDIIDYEELSKLQTIVSVNPSQFVNRSDLENWIEIELNSNPKANFLFTELEELIDLEQKTLQSLYDPISK